MDFRKCFCCIGAICLYKLYKMIRLLIRKPSSWVVFGLFIYIINIKFFDDQIGPRSGHELKRDTLQQENFTLSSRNIARNIVFPDIGVPLEVGSNSKCAPYPENYMLKFSNDNWQVFQISNWTMYIFSAYYDTRERSVAGDYFRILVLMARGLKENYRLTCQLWSVNASTPIISRVSEYHQIWPSEYGKNNNDTLLPFILSCPVPQNTKHIPIREPPFAVSIVVEKCAKATNKIKINYNFLPADEEKENFAVCVKGLDFPDSDISIRLIEWIEFLGLMGVHKIYFYEFAVHPNSKRVLDYYVQKGAIDSAGFTLPGFYPNDPSWRHKLLLHNLNLKRRIELIPFNDCFYRNMYKYKYITLLDIDEVIVPQQSKSWNEMMETFEERAKNRSSRSGKSKNDSFQAAFYGVGQTGCFVQDLKRDWFPEIPTYMHMLQHIYKLPFKRKSFAGVKGFADPTMVFSILNHNPRACLRGFHYCSRYFSKHEDAQLQHYRTYKKHCGERTLRRNITKCKELSCQDYVEDKTIWRYKDELIGRVMAVIKELDIPIPTAQHVP